MKERRRRPAVRENGKIWIKYVSFFLLICGLLSTLGSPAAYAEEVTVTEWTDLVNEFAHSDDDRTIILGANITQAPGSLQMPGGKSRTLDLAGYTLSISVAAGSGNAAVGVAAGTTLTIKDSSPSQVGRLVATATGANGGGAGIGGNRGGSVGTIIINSGNVVATGAEGAGIGAAFQGTSFGAVTINGGNVQASSTYASAGIGGGLATSGTGTVTITGGTVLATGYDGGAGIGGAAIRAQGVDVLITGGHVTAKGGIAAAGIGGGQEGGAGGSVTITGGEVIATGGAGAAGIGGGSRGAGGAVTITGGVVRPSAGTNQVSGIGSGGANTNFGSLSNNGTITIPSGGVLIIPAGVTITNTGIINGAGTIKGAGTIENIDNGSIDSSLLDSSAPVITGNKFVLSFHLNGATEAVPAPIQVLGTSLEAVGENLPTPPARTGYSFNGWYTAAVGGNLWTESNTISESMTLYAHWNDLVAPTVTLSTSVGNATNGPFMVKAVFNEAVTGFDVEDVAVSNGAAGGFNVVSEAEYTFVVTPAVEGTVAIDVAEGAAQDAGGNDNVAAAQLSLEYDVTVPTVTLGTAAGNPVVGPFTAIATFSEEVTGFDASDVRVGNGWADNFNVVDETRYTFIVTPAGDGAVTVDVDEGAAHDWAGNESAAAARLSRNYDMTPPTVTLSTSVGNAINGPFAVTATFSEEVTGFDVSDVIVGNGEADSFNALSGSEYTFLVTPDVDGAVTIDVDEGAAEDLTGNASVAAVQLRRMYDAIAPTVTLSTSVGNATNEPFMVTATFSEEVTGFDVSDVIIGNGEADSFNAVSGTEYTFLVTPEVDGVVTINVDGGAAQDLAGNASESAVELRRTYDVIAPTVTLSTVAGNATNESFMVTATFSEEVTGFDVSDVIIGNGEADGFNAVSGTEYTFVVIPAVNGAVTIDIDEGAAQDLAGNASESAVELRRTYDVIAPTVTLSTSVGNATNEPFMVTATFSEEVTGFDVSDVIIGNGEAGSFNVVSGTEYTFVVTPAVDGAVTIDIDEGAAQDLAGNASESAVELRRTYDVIAPTVILSTSVGNATNEPFMVTATFSEEVTGFDVSDVIVGNGEANSFNAVSGTEYTFLVTPEVDGVVTINVDEGAAQDLAGNASESAVELRRTYDVIAPTVILSTSVGNATNEPFMVTATFSEEVTGVDVSDVIIGNGEADSFNAVSGTEYTFLVTPEVDGVVTINVDGGAAEDLAGNASESAVELRRTYDVIAPTVTLSTSVGNATNEPFMVTATFSEEVTGFDVSDVIVGNGEAGNFNVVNGTEYTFLVTPEVDGVVTINVDEGAAQDLAGNASEAAVRLSRIYDVVAPTLTLFTEAGSATNEPFMVTATFSEEVTGFDVSDVIIGNGEADGFNAVSGTEYTFVVTPIVDGEVTIDVDEEAAEDLAGNASVAAVQLSRIYDVVAPTVTLSTSVGNATNEPFMVTATFSEEVTGFDVSDVIIGNGEADGFNAVSGMEYTFLVTPEVDGVVTINVDGGAAQDLAGNASESAVELRRTYDVIAPTVILSTSVGNAMNEPFMVTATFSEEVTGFDVSDVIVGNGEAGSFNALSGTEYTFLVTPEVDGVVTINVDEGAAQDLAGNASEAAVQLSRIYDVVAPTVTLSTSVGNATNEPFMVTATFSEEVTGFDVSDVIVGNGEAGNFNVVNGTEYTFLVMPEVDGVVTINVDEGAAQDLAGNASEAAVRLSRIYDVVAPTLTLFTEAGSETNEPFMVTATFSEEVTGFDVSDVIIGNGEADGFNAVSGTEYTFLVTPEVDGVVTINVDGGAAQDLAGNASELAVELRRTYDVIAPTVILSTSVGNATNEPFMVTATFSEEVTGVDVSDVIIGNGEADSFNAVSGTEYTFLVTPDVDGVVTINVDGGAAQDLAGNASESAVELRRTYDVIAPTVTLSTVAGNATNESFMVTATFSEEVIGFDVSDVIIGNGEADSFNAVSGTEYTFLVTPDVDGVVTINVDGGAAQDLAGNASESAVELRRTYDVIAPTVTLSTVAGNATNESFMVTATFSEEVTGFDVSDVIIGNGEADGFNAVSGMEYTFLVTPEVDGVVTINVDEGAAQDLAGNASMAAVELRRTYDVIAPTVTLSTSVGNATNEPFMVTATFSEEVTGFDVSDVIIANGEADSFNAVSGMEYTFLVMPEVDGAVTIDVDEGAAQDLAGNASESAVELRRTYDVIAPTVTLSTSVGNATNEPFMVTATFSEEVTGFDVSDVIVGNGEADSFNALSGTEYAFLVTPDVDGVVTIDVDEEAAEDLAGNASVAAVQLSRIYDVVAPTVTLSTSVGNATNEPFMVTATFSEEVTGFDVTDVIVGNGEAGNFNAMSGTEYTFVVTPEVDGVVTIDVDEGAAEDLAGNTSAAAVQLSRTYDVVAPTVTLSTPVANATNEPFTVTSTFSEEVTGFDVTDVIIGNGEAGSFNAVSGTEYTFVVTPAVDGAVTIDVGEEAAEDLAGNVSVAAAQLSRTYDVIAPTVTLSTSVGNATNEPFTVTATFSEEVTGFDVSDVIIGNGEADSFNAVSGTEYTFLVTPEVDGAVTIDVDEGAAQDAAGNASTAASQLSRIYDATAPSIQFSPIGSSDPAQSVSTSVTVTDMIALTELWYVWTSSVTAPAAESPEWKPFTSGDTLSKANEEGEWHLHVRALDSAGNAADGRSNSFLMDNIAPTIVMLGDNPYYVAAGQPYEEAGATATDNIDGELDAAAIVISGDVDTNRLGSYEIRYETQDQAGNVSVATRSVQVYDGDSPIIVLNGNNPMVVAQGSRFEEPGATAQDEQEGDLTESITVTGTINTDTVDMFELAYDVADSAGNAATTVTRSVYVIAPPVLTLLGDAMIAIEKGRTFVDPGATAVDAYFGDLTGEIRVDGTVDTRRPGEYILRYTVTNEIGQTSEEIRTVTVEDVPDEGNGWNDQDNGGSGTEALGLTITINGIEITMESTKETTSDGRSIERLRLTAEQTAELFAASAEAVIEVAGLSDVFKIDLPATSLHQAQNTIPNAQLRVIANGNGMSIPLSALTNVADEATVTVTIGRAPSTGGAAFRDALSRLGAESLIEHPIFYSLEADGRAVERWSEAYRERTLTFAVSAEPDQATLVWIDELGELHFVPAEFSEDGRTVTIRSLQDGQYGVIRLNRTFDDVEGHWAQADIELMANKLIVEGKRTDGFAPNDPITRAEFATLLVRALGLPEYGANQEGNRSFVDVTESNWYSGAIGAASAAGLIGGYEDGSFRPQANITREQMAAMIVRALAYAGRAPQAVAEGAIGGDGYADGGNIAEWAADAVRQLTAAGIMQGTSEGEFAPKSAATRAQSATLLKRLLQYARFINA